MLEIFDVNTIPLTMQGSLDLVQYLHTVRNQSFLVNLSDGQVTMNGRWLSVNVFLWRPLVKRGYPVSKRHSVWEGLLTKEVLANIQTEIYNDAIDINHKLGTPVVGAVESEILYDIMDTFDHMHKWISTKLGEYHLSISAFELCDLLDSPEIKPLINIDLTTEMEVSIKSAEDKLERQGKEIVAKLRNSSIPSNIIAPFLNLGLLSPNQLPRVVMALGFRTDASDQMVRKPITTSYVEGIKDIKDFAIESLDAKKTIYYNKNAMPDSQYDNRKVQILASSVRHLYKGDCGTKLLVPYYIHEGNARQVYYKNIVTNDGELIQLSSKNIDQFIGHTVRMRSPLVCNHTDGVCHACGGRLTDFMHSNIVIGIASTVEYMSAASQLVLSAKHFTRTSSVTYKIPEALNDILIVKQNDIFIRSHKDVSRLKIKINFRDIPHLEALRGNESDDDEVISIGEQQFSKLNYVTFLDSNDIPETAEINMVSEGTIPYFSSEMIQYIKENFRSIKIGDEIIIPLKKFEHTTEPLMRCVVESNSMIKFNKVLETFLESDIKKYTDLVEALEAFTSIVYKEIKTNIMHLEVVLKAFLITNEDNYDIPVVTNIHDVKFEKLTSLIPKRSLGQQFAYQELMSYISDPSTYVLPHPRGLYDPFFYPDA